MIFNCTLLNMITNTIFIEKVKKNFTFFTRGDLDGRNHANFINIYPYPLYRNDRIRPKKINIKGGGFQPFLIL